MKITNVRAMDSHRLLIDFEEGNRVVFNMERMAETHPCGRLKNLETFRAVRFEDKAIYWEAPGEKPGILPIRFTVNSILFSLR